LPTLRFWKPYDVLTQFTDASGRSTLADFIDLPGVYPAGRLDRDSEGLLLLTSDGALQARLAHPRYHLPKIYLAQVEGEVSDEALERLRAGPKLADGPTRPILAVRREEAPDLPPRPVPIRYRAKIMTQWLELTLTEGRNRQVRRMTAAVGHPTLRLVRIAIGPIGLEGLEPGRWEELDAARLFPRPRRKR
jgi:23S rRNA pseudouridine2457 synthase